MKNHPPILSVKNLVKNFGKLNAVNDISFSVKKGEIFAFLGPNGAGKTTTIKILTTLLNKTKGEVNVNEFNIEKESKSVRNSIGIVFQDPSLDDDLTAFENMNFHGLLYGVTKKLRKERVESLLKFVGLWAKKDILVKNYSGGMKRRLEIARALIHHPKLIFLDEPTLGLDPQTRKGMWDYLKELNKQEKMTIFFTTHYIEEAEKAADHVAIIDHGKIVSRGTPKEIIKSSKTKTLEEAFLKLTGHAIREEEASNLDSMRLRNKAWGRR